MNKYRKQLLALVTSTTQVTLLLQFLIMLAGLHKKKNTRLIILTLRGREQTGRIHSILVHEQR